VFKYSGLCGNKIGVFLIRPRIGLVRYMQVIEIF